jgi:hypothetical protein
MKSCAEEIMDYCQSKGVGKIGEQLFYARVFDDKKQRKEAVVFSDADGGKFERRLDAIAYEHDLVDVCIRTDTPSRGYELVAAVQTVVEAMKGYISPDKTKYESALLVSPPKLIYGKADVFIHTFLIKVMRRTVRT